MSEKKSSQEQEDVIDALVAGSLGVGISAMSLMRLEESLRIIRTEVECIQQQIQTLQENNLRAAQKFQEIQERRKTKQAGENTDSAE